MATATGPLAYADRRALSVAPVNSSRRVPFFVAEGGSFVFPAHYGPAGRRRPGAPPAQVAFPPFAGSLRGEQRAALASVLESIGERGSALCEMRTGFGKTVVALALCAELRVRALVLVHTHTLLAQWVERAREFVGVEPPAARGNAAFVRCVASDAPLVVAMIQTVVAADAPTGRFDLVVYDEVHHVCARAFSRAIFALRSPLAVGLSATVERADGLSVALGWFFGPSIRTEGPTIRATVERLALDDHGVEATTVYNKALRRDAVNFSRLVSDLAACDARTQQIAGRVRELLAAGRVALVVCSRVAHCAAMRDALRPFSVRVLAGGKRQDAAGAFNAIVGTAGTVGEGFDEPCLDTLVFATPVVAVTQAIGRILRRRNANPPLVLDPVDPIAVCSAQWFRRLAAYRDAGHCVRLHSPGTGARGAQGCQAPQPPAA
jgi:superfamily II DNA or RNA helicase